MSMYKHIPLHRGESCFRGPDTITVFILSLPNSRLQDGDSWVVSQAFFVLVTFLPPGFAPQVTGQNTSGMQ